VRVFILGAGFSTTAGLPTSSKILARLTDSKLEVLLDELNLKVETFEELLSKIDLELYYLRKANNENRRHELLKGLRRELVSKLTSLMQSSLTPEAVKTYKDFISLIDVKEDAIISYNYDLVLEKVLDSKGIKYNYLYDRYNDQNRDLPIIKLHGSINHFHCDRCDKIIILDLKQLEERLIINYCPHCNNQMDRALIPPTLLKRFVGTAVEAIWPKALEILQKAEELYFIGYRIPDADLLSYQLFLFSLLSRQKGYQKAEIVLGPQVDNYRVYRNLYSKRGVRLVETGLYFEEWLNIKV